MANNHQNSEEAKEAEDESMIQTRISCTLCKTNDFTPATIKVKKNYEVVNLF